MCHCSLNKTYCMRLLVMSQLQVVIINTIRVKVITACPLSTVGDRASPITAACIYNSHL